MNFWKSVGSSCWIFCFFVFPIYPVLGQGMAFSPAKAAAGYCFVFSSFSNSISFREAFTLLETSFPCENSLWRSLNVRFSGAPLMEFSCSWPLKRESIMRYVYLFIKCGPKRSEASIIGFQYIPETNEAKRQTFQTSVAPFSLGKLLTLLSISLVAPCDLPLILQLLLLCFQCMN